MSSKSFVVCMALAALAPGHLGAQNASPNRFGLGVSWFGGWISANASNFVGAEGYARIAGGPFWSARVDGAYMNALKSSVVIICPSALSIAEPACDTRTLGKLGALVATLVVGPRESRGLRHFYALGGMGVAATRWGGGIHIPALSAGVSVEAGAGAGPTVVIFQAGIGSEFRALGGNRIELRLDRVTPSTPADASGRLGNNSGRAASVTFGWLW
jgi:hypothetical protein